MWEYIGLEAVYAFRPPGGRMASIHATVRGAGVFVCLSARVYDDCRPFWNTVARELPGHTHVHLGVEAIP
jgi:hypothetical protein